MKFIFKDICFHGFFVSLYLPFIWLTIGPHIIILVPDDPKCSNHIHNYTIQIKKNLKTWKKVISIVCNVTMSLKGTATDPKSGLFFSEKHGGVHGHSQY